MEVITVLKNKTTLTPFVFYNGFLNNVAEAYRKQSQPVIFKLFENGDELVYDSNYWIDPIVIPLILSLFEQLSKYHKQAMELVLYNNDSTVDVLEFLFHSDFFYLCGENKNPIHPIGREIADFNEGFLGSFKGKNHRNEHRVRAYSLNDKYLLNEIENYSTDEEKRDYLSSFFSYKVKEHFQELLFENDFTDSCRHKYVDILSELITNGVVHSQSDTYALMFVDMFITKFSISDNGIGLRNTIKNKPPTPFYEPQFLTRQLNSIDLPMELPKIISENLHAIFETLFYSSLRNRNGLFDLMINVVLKSNGYFRLHSENCQIIISRRMNHIIHKLSVQREEIYSAHIKYMHKILTKNDYKKTMSILSRRILNVFIELYKTTLYHFDYDFRFSSMRFFKVKFRGVHIEVEIPNR